MSPASDEDIPLAQAPPVAVTPTQPRPRPTSSSAAVKATRKAVPDVPPTITKFVAGGGTVQRSNPAAPNTVINISSGSEGEGPTPMDKDDSMYRGNLGRNRVDVASTSSVIRTRATARASAAPASGAGSTGGLSSPFSFSSKPATTTNKRSAAASARVATGGAKKKAARPSEVINNVNVKVEDDAEPGLDGGFAVISQIEPLDARPAKPAAKNAASRKARAQGTPQTVGGPSLGHGAVPLFSPPVTPTPVRNKRTSSEDDWSGDESDVVGTRPSKRVCLVDNIAQDVSAYEDESDADNEPMEVVQDNAVDDSFDAEHSASDNDEEEANNKSVGYSCGVLLEVPATSVNKGKKRASHAPTTPPPEQAPFHQQPDDDDNASFAKALGLPEVTEEVDAGSTSASSRYALVHVDLTFYRVGGLPQKCKVTNVVLQDKVLKKYYTNTLPPLRHGVVTSWSEQRGEGMVRFSDWGVTCPHMKFKSCINIIEFRSHGRYVNPCCVSPLDFLIKHVTGSFEKYQLFGADRRHIICISAVRTRESCLTAPNQCNGRKYITGVHHSQEWERYVGCICTSFDQEELEGSISQDAIQYSTRPAPQQSHGESSTPHTNSSPSIKFRSGTSRKSPKDSQSLSGADNVPVYDCRSRIVDLSRDLNNLDSLPLWREEVPSGSFAAVAHTIAIYKNADGFWTLSLNVLWVMLIGSPARQVYRVTQVSDSK